jgi:hypothetical protein
MTAIFEEGTRVWVWFAEDKDASWIKGTIEGPCNLISQYWLGNEIETAHYVVRLDDGHGVWPIDERRIVFIGVLDALAEI